MLNVKESDFNKLNLIKLLREFTPREMNNFGKFVRSPFFNNQSTLIRLFDELKKYYPDFIVFKDDYIYVIETKGEVFSDTKKNMLLKMRNK